MKKTKNKNRVAKEVIELQEQNRLLIAENQALRQSLAVFSRGSYGENDRKLVEVPAVETKERPITPTRSPSRQIEELSVESLMSIVMNRMIELVRKDLKAQQQENSSKSEDFMDSLRHVFVDSLHILCECLINPKGFWGVHAFDAMHPMSWLIDKFPVPENMGVLRSTASDNELPSLAWYPLHWCVLSNSSDLIDVQVLSEHYCSTPQHRLRINEEISPLTLSVSKPRPNMEIVNALVDLDPIVVRAKSPVDGSLPIMHACAYNQEEATVRYLCRLHADCLKEQDAQGYRAINYCASMGSDVVMRYLLKEDPKSGLYCTSSPANKLLGPGDINGGIGNTALHDAASNRRLRGDGNEEDYGLCIDVMMELFHANPSAIKLPNADGALPLHIAARHGSLSLVQLLHGLYPAAVNVADNEQLLPLEYASARVDKQEGLKVVEYLAKL